MYDVFLDLEIFFLLGLVLVNRLAFVYVFTRRWRLTFTENPILTFLYFILATILVAFLFPREVADLYHPGSILMVVFFLFMLLVFNPWVYRHLKRDHHLPMMLSKASPEQAFLAIDERYLFSKTGDVLFQQTTVGILLMVLYHAGLSLEVLVPLFALIFALLHVHMVFSARPIWAMYFIASAAAGGFILPFILLTMEGGIYLTTVLHMLWYVGSGALFGYVEESGRARV